MTKTSSVVTGDKWGRFIVSTTVGVTLAVVNYALVFSAGVSLVPIFSGIALVVLVVGVVRGIAAAAAPAPPPYDLGLKDDRSRP